MDTTQSMIEAVQLALNGLERGLRYAHLSDGEGPITWLLARKFDLRDAVEYEGVGLETIEEIVAKIDAMVSTLRHDANNQPRYIE